MGAATEGLILEAATELFAARGFHGTTMRDLAGAVGVRPASLYNHWPSKHDLLVAISGGVMRDLLAGARTALEQHASAPARLRALIVAHVAYHAGPGRQAAIVADVEVRSLEGGARERAVALRDEYEAAFAAAIAQGVVEEGWPVADVSVVVKGVVTMCTGVAQWFSADGRLTVEQVADVYADFCLRALAGA